MIVDITPTAFELVRGDTFILPLKLNSGTRLYPEQYTLQGDDTLYIGIMLPGQAFEESIIKCALNTHSPKDAEGNTIFRLDSVHTSDLEPGKYYISIKLVNDGVVTTLLNNQLFFITGSSPSTKVRYC